MILVDTSAWVEYDRATGSRADQRLAELIATDGSLTVTEPVPMEVLAGARSDARQADLRRLLLRFGLTPFDAVTTSTPPPRSTADVGTRASPLVGWSTA